MKPRRIDFSPGDWLSGTLELSLEEEGLYIRICALIWSRSDRITEELLKASTTTHGNKVNALLASLAAKGKITRNGREIGQKRAENELENAWKRVRKASENGVLGNQIKKVRNATRKTVANATSTSTSTIKEETPHTPRQRGAVAGEFEAWWQGFPNKVGKGAAERAWPTARRLASAAELTDGVQRYVQSKPPDRPWCGPAVWLNQKRWLDEPAAAEEALSNGRVVGPTGPAPTYEELFGNDDRRKVAMAH